MTEQYTTQDWHDAGEYRVHENDDGTDVEVFYVEDNRDADETIVLVHGFPTSSWDWTKIWDTLADEYHVVTVDMVGFGFSDKPSGYPYSLFDQADLHEELLAKLGVKNAYVLAHDYGDTVAQELLARQKEDENYFEIRSAFLLNGGIFYEAQEPADIQKLLLGPDGAEIAQSITRDVFGAAFADVFADETRPTEEELDGFWRLITHNGGNEVMHEVIKYLHERRDNRDRWAGALRDTDVPLRFVVGPEDPVSGEKMAERYEAVVPEPDVRRLDGIGHYPQWEAPQAVLDEFLGFVR